MSLTNKIEPGDALDGTKVRANFVDLETLAENMDEAQIEAGAFMTRHLNGTWTQNDSVTTVASTALGAIAADLATKVFATTSGRPFYVLATVTLEATGANPDATLLFNVDAVTKATRYWWTAGATEKVIVGICYAMLATAATHTIALRGGSTGATVTAHDGCIVVLTPVK